jgi:S1-C subfamily serine protease
MVLALGYGPRASWGVISALGPRWRTWRGGEIDRLVRLDLVLYPGFSGGPLVDAAGRVIGLNTSGLARESRLALPVATVARVTDELLRKGHVARAYLGIGMQPVPLPEPLRAALGLPGDGGLIVVMVEPDGPAARAGLLLGDVLVALDGAPTRDLEDVQAQLGGERIGTTVTALVVRAGARVEVRITVGERPRRGAS